MGGDLKSLIENVEASLASDDLASCVDLLGWTDWRVEDEAYTFEHLDTDREATTTVWRCSSCPWSDECSRSAFKKCKCVSRKSPDAIVHKLEMHAINGGYHSVSAMEAKEMVDALDIDKVIDFYEESWTDRQRYSIGASTRRVHHATILPKKNTVLKRSAQTHIMGHTCDT